VMSEPGTTRMTAELLEARLIDFAVRVISLANRLGATLAGKHIASQIVRSGTSPAANYSEARSAESRGDFVHKLRIGVKELNETSVWLRICARGALVKPDLLDQLLVECDELKRIFGASLRTARLRPAKLPSER
jgi:four helix bundle protein